MTSKIIPANRAINHDKTYKIVRVRDLAQSEKPREKLIKKGVISLNMTELLAIVLGVGTRKEEVLSMSSRLLHEYGEKAITQLKDPKLIETELKIPLTKACQIVACFELGRRFYQKKPSRLISLRTAKQVFEYLKDMRNLEKEQFRGLYLNNNYQLIHDEIISIGTINASLVHPREVFRPALEYSAVAIIVAHNHPSNNVKATRTDIEITTKLIQAGRILGIEVLDHLIIGQDKFTNVI